MIDKRSSFSNVGMNGSCFVVGCVCMFSLSFTLLIQNHVFLRNIIIGISYWSSTYIKLQLNPKRHEGLGCHPPYIWKFAYNFTAGLCIFAIPSTESTNSRLCSIVHVFILKIFMYVTCVVQTLWVIQGSTAVIFSNLQNNIWN